VYVFVMTSLFLHVFERQLVCVNLLCVILMHVHNFASVEVFNKAVLTYLLCCI